jgi:hypothetical protein
MPAPTRQRHASNDRGIRFRVVNYFEFSFNSFCPVTPLTFPSLIIKGNYQIVYTRMPLVRGEYDSQFRCRALQGPP